MLFVKNILITILINNTLAYLYNATFNYDKTYDKSVKQWLQYDHLSFQLTSVVIFITLAKKSSYVHKQN